MLTSWSGFQAAAAEAVAADIPASRVPPHGCACTPACLCASARQARLLRSPQRIWHAHTHAQRPSSLPVPLAAARRRRGCGCRAVCHGGRLPRQGGRCGHLFMRQVGFDLCRAWLMPAVCCGVTASLPCKADHGACFLVLEAATHRGLLCATAGCWALHSYQPSARCCARLQGAQWRRRWCGLLVGCAAHERGADPRPPLAVDCGPCRHAGRLPALAGKPCALPGSLRYYCCQASGQQR